MMCGLAMLFTINRVYRFTVLAAFCTCVSGCSLTSLMFYPFKVMPMTPDELGMSYEEVHHTSADGTQLVSWWLPAQSKQGEPIPAKGSVLYLHGNAQNISYHQFNVNWLPAQGYNVFLLGYRQFGQSQGIAKLPNVFLDVHSGLDWVLQRTPNEPTYVLGQSMGASLSVFALASYNQSNRISGVALDAAFDSYPGIAAHAMSNNWFTWPLILPAYLVTSEYDPEDWIAKWPEPTALLMMHSPDDKVIPYEKGLNLFNHANKPKHWLDNSGPHIATFRDPAMRQALLDFFSRYGSQGQALYDQSQADHSMIYGF